MSVYSYIRMTCPNCESEYAVDYQTENTEGEPDYCPFCGEEMPEVLEELEDTDTKSEDEEDFEE